MRMGICLRIYFSQLLNVHYVSNFSQIEIHTAEPLALGPSFLEPEIAITKLKKHKSLLNRHQILAELIRAGGETFVSAFEGIYFCAISQKRH
jgi:hypothetical protein